MKSYKILSIVVISFVFLLTAGYAAAQASTCGAQDYDCKIRDYQSQIKADPKNTEAYYNLGIAFQNKGEYAQSVAMFDLYLTIGVSNREYMADGYYNRGFSQLKLGNNDLAVKDITKAIELNPTGAGFYTDRGKAYNALKNFNLAIADFTKAIGFKKGDTSTYFGRGYAYMELKNYGMAIPDFTKVMELDPGDEEAYYNRGTIYYRLKQYVKAITDLDKYIALNKADAPSMADGYENRGLAHLYSGNRQKAVDDFTKAIQLMPNKKSPYESRAVAYRQMGKIALAEADEEKAAELENQ